ncbi:hypothetical protein I8H83_03090 [Candidatus Saccharibacteria bacterium]|nr:hypothetical protein [Candidatus Saccharibacteria bacterium]MBH2007561.1 hypothetical protein [Candidatus Saccharibacteria bacterium]
MYRTLSTMAALIVFIVASLVAAPVSHAVSSEQGQLKPDDSSLYSLVTMDCLEVKFKLNDVHRRDKLARVTLGQGYDNASTNLMGRLNSRIVENKLDGGGLIKIAADFEKSLQKFRSDYTKYDEALVTLIKADCQSQMQTYYVNLQTTKELRATVYGDVKALDDLMTQYHEAYKDFRKTISVEEEKRANDAN